MKKYTPNIAGAKNTCSDDEIERLLLPAIFACVCGRLGDGRAKRTFSKLGADTHTIELTAKELVIDYFFWGQRNGAFRKRVERDQEPCALRAARTWRHKHTDAAKLP